MNEKQLIEIRNKIDTIVESIEDLQAYLKDIKDSGNVEGDYDLTDVSIIFLGAIPRVGVKDGMNMQESVSGTGEGIFRLLRQSETVDDVLINGLIREILED